MVHHPMITGILLGVAVALAILCAIGLLVMRDAFQRLHFATPVVSISTLLIIIAVFVEEPDVQSRVKVVLIGLILFSMNAVLSHASARAFFIRKTSHWIPEPKDQVPIHGRDAIAGEKQEET